MSAGRSPAWIAASMRTRQSEVALRQGIEFRLVLAEFSVERLHSLGPS